MSKAADPLETAVSIQEWQKNHPHDASKPEGSVTARLCDRVLDVFREALVQLAQPNHAERPPNLSASAFSAREGSSRFGLMAAASRMGGWMTSSPSRATFDARL